MGGLGSHCVRTCVHSSHEYAEDLLTKTGTTVGHASSSSRGPGDVEAVKARGQDAGDAAHLAGVVPPVSNWLLALQSAGRRQDQPKETPRFDEVYQSPRLSTRSCGEQTPRGSVGGEFVTPRLSPRDSQSGAQGADSEAASAEITYEGTMLDGLKHGVGRLRLQSSTYEGEFAYDLKHGQGTLYWDDGRKYSGKFMHGKFHGTAMMTWPDGRKYIGQYAEDRKHGKGTFSWLDGRRYEGEWVCGKRHGIGIYTNAKGLTRTGTWDKDRPITWEPAGALPPKARLAQAGGQPLPGAAVQPPELGEASPVIQASPRRPMQLAAQDGQLDVTPEADSAVLDLPRTPAAGPPAPADVEAWPELDSRLAALQTEADVIISNPSARVDVI